MPERLNGRLLLTTDAVGGVWRYSLDLARGLRERGVGCILAVLGPGPNPAQRAEAQAIPGLDLVQTGLPLDWTAEDAATLRATSRRLATLATLMGATGVHLHAPALVGDAPWPVPVVAVAHSDVGTWWRAMRSGPPPADFAWRMDATGAGLLAADRVIAPSQSHADAVRAVYGDMDIAVVFNGAAPVPPAAGPRTRAVLTAGRLWDEAKGAATLDRAAVLLDAPIRAAGPVQGPAGGAAAFPNLDLLGNLDPPGMAQAYASATVFASAARYEPFGLSVLEAALAGMRLVLWELPTFRELWDGAAWFVTPEADWPAVLHAALDDDGDGGALERAGRYTLDRTVDGTAAVHRGLGLSQNRAVA